MYSTFEGNYMKVNELRPKTAVPEIELEVVTVAEPRQFASANGSGTVCNAAAKDDTGEVSVTLWNEQTEQVKEGDKIVIQDGWCSEFKGRIQISTGKKGKLIVNP